MSDIALYLPRPGQITLDCMALNGPIVGWRVRPSWAVLVTYGYRTGRAGTWAEMLERMEDEKERIDWVSLEAEVVTDVP